MHLDKLKGISVDNMQYGGTHYKETPKHLQHWNVVAQMGWDYFIGNATKYLWRLGKKGDQRKALEDINKAIHYLQKKRDIMEEEMGLVEGEPGPGYVNQD